MSAVEQPAPAIGYSVVANLPGDRQVTCQCFVAEDEADEVINAKLDRIFRVIDRQKARYEVEDLTSELDKLEATYAQLQEDLKRADLDYEKAQESLNVQIATLKDEAKSVHDAGYDDHVNSGRRGEYRPQGTVLNRINAANAAAQQAVEQKAKNEAERDNHRAQIDVSIKRYEGAIAKAKEQRAAKLALLGE